LNGAAIDFSPSFSPHARILSVTSNGHALPFTAKASAYDQLLHMQIPLDGHEQTVEVHSQGDLRIMYDSVLPPLGGASQGLRLTHESWSPDRETWTMQFEGASSGDYELAVSGAQEIRSIEGGELLRGQDGSARLRVHLPEQASTPTNLTLHLTGRKP
jgi:hypothetical protein